MKLPRLAVPLLLLLAVACKTSNRDVDLATNEMLYVDVPFRTQAPGDRALFVAPLADAREAANLPIEEKGFPITYGSDEFWDRPVRDMVADVLVRQLQGSGLFTSVATEASPQALVLLPSIVTWSTGSIEQVAGGVSFAEVGLRLQVLGPADGTGKRAVLLEQTYGNRQLSELALKPTSPYRLVCRALQKCMGKVLAGLDGSNVGRSNVPMVVTAPAEATAASR